MCGSKRGSTSIEALIVVVILIIALFQMYLFTANHVDLIKVEMIGVDISNTLTYQSELLPNEALLASPAYHLWLNKAFKDALGKVGVSGNLDWTLRKSYYDTHLGEGVVHIELTRNYLFFSQKSKVVYHFKNLFRGNCDQTGGYVYITNYGEKYHKNTCWHLYASKIPLLLKEAVKRGYEACKNCGG